MVVIPLNDPKLIRLKVLVDSREKNPLLFPPTLVWYPQAGKDTAAKLFRLEPEVREIYTGDYTLEGYEQVVAIERKGSLTEIKGNLYGADRPRFVKAWKRLVDMPHRWLLLDIPARGYRRAYGVDNPEQLEDEIQRLALTDKVPIIIGMSAEAVGTRQQLGASIVRLMLNTIWLKHRADETQALRRSITNGRTATGPPVVEPLDGLPCSRPSADHAEPARTGPVAVH